MSRLSASYYWVKGSLSLSLYLFYRETNLLPILSNQSRYPFPFCFQESTLPVNHRWVNCNTLKFRKNLRKERERESREGGSEQRGRGFFSESFSLMFHSCSLHDSWVLPTAALSQVLCSLNLALFSTTLSLSLSQYFFGFLGLFVKYKNHCGKLIT